MLVVAPVILGTLVLLVVLVMMHPVLVVILVMLVALVALVVLLLVVILAVLAVLVVQARRGQSCLRRGVYAALHFFDALRHRPYFWLAVITALQTVRPSALD